MGRSSDARDRLVESASELWYSRSYADVGVNEICGHAGVRKGSFYHFFPSKRELALAVIDERWAQARSQYLEPTVASELPPLDKLVRLAEMLYEFQCSRKEASGVICGCPFGNLASEMSTQDEVLRGRLQDLFDDWLGYFEQILREAAARGDVEGLEPRRTARTLQAYVEGVMVLAKTSNDPEVISDLTPGILRLAGATPERLRTLAVAGV
jgi:TetR/AcrR family transcriptional regulator, transcriptional repressor for nem operon